jgi:hypothetical protein
MESRNIVNTEVAVISQSFITNKVFFLKKDYHNNLLWTPNLKKNTLSDVRNVEKFKKKFFKK